MPKITPGEFWTSLKKGPLAPVYLLHGDDRRTVDRAYKEIEQKTLAGGEPEFNADYFHGRDADPSQVVAAANTMPMMADRRLVAVRHVEGMKAAKVVEDEDGEPVEEGKNPVAPLDYILKYLESPNPTTVLLLHAGKLDLRKFAKLENRAAKVGVSINFASPKRWEIPKAIMAMARERGRRMDEPAATALAELAGEDMMAVEQELEKVFLYCADKKTVSEGDVLAAVAEVSEAVVYDFCDALQARDAETALRIYRRMREQEDEPLRVLGMVARHFRMIWKIQALKAKKEPEGVIARQVGLNEWIMKKNYLPRINEYPPRDAGRVTRLLADLDTRLKSTRTDKDVLFERAILRLCLRRL